MRDHSRRPWSDSLRALRKLALWKGREVERVRGEVRRCDEVRAERRVKGLVREDMVVSFRISLFFFLYLGGQWGCMNWGFHGKWRRYKKNRSRSDAIFVRMSRPIIASSI